MTFDVDAIEKAAIAADLETGSDIRFSLHACRLLWEAAQKEAAKRCAEICRASEAEHERNQNPAEAIGAMWCASDIESQFNLDK